MRAPDPLPLAFNAQIEALLRQGPPWHTMRPPDLRAFPGAAHGFHPHPIPAGGEATAAINSFLRMHLLRMHLLSTHLGE